MSKRIVTGLSLLTVVGAASLAPAVAHATDNPVSVTFTVLDTCASNFGGGNFVLKVGNTTVATLNGGNDCTCGPPLRTFTTTDPAVLAQVGAAGSGCTAAAVTLAGSAYVAWVRADISRSTSGVERLCLQDTNGGNCDVNDLCSAGYAQFSGSTFSAGPADTDADGLNDCVDPDIDGDGLANAADNCPSVANANQADTDHNGQGDACDPFDRDGDGIWNINDNCPDAANLDQADADSNGVGNVCDANFRQVVAVPWGGDRAKAHQVYAGGALVLQAVAVNPASGNPVPLASGTWDPGDGTGAVAINVSNSLALELTHTYNGAVNQPYTATIRVVDTSGAVYTDTFKAVIGPNTRDTRVNMAIDKGLWNLHKRMVRGTSDGVSSAHWVGYSGYDIAATDSSVQAFEINGHRERNDAGRDPYVADVARGLRYLLSAEHGRLSKMSVPTQNGNDPDQNHNGYGLVVSTSDHSSYLGGQFMDGLVASGTPDKVATVGIAGVRGRKYKDIIQDMLDGYSWGMSDNTGGWYYTYSDTTGSNDTSASHWWGIGVLASHVFGLDAPAWVKNIQWTVGVPLMQNLSLPSSCNFGYTDSTNPIWDNGTNVTAAGLILMNADGIPKTNQRYTCAMGYLASQFDGSMGNFYTMYQLAKAMRTALDGSGATSPITLLNGTRDWYAAYAD